MQENEEERDRSSIEMVKKVRGFMSKVQKFRIFVYTASRAECPHDL